MGDAISDGWATRIPLYKDNTMVKEFVLPLPFSFDNALVSLQSLIDTLAESDNVPLDMETPQMTSYAKGNYLAALAMLAYVKAIDAGSVTREKPLLSEETFVRAVSINSDRHPQASMMIAHVENTRGRHTKAKEICESLVGLPHVPGRIAESAFF